MASIRKLASGNYQVQIRRAGMPAVTRSFAKKKDADAFIRQVEGNTELHRKLGRAAAHIPKFRDWVMTFLSDHRGKDPDMVRKLNWWADQFGDLPVTKIDEFMVDDALHVLVRKGRTGKRGVTGSTLNRYKAALSSCLIGFIRHPDFKRLGFTNPVRKESVSRFKENPPKDRFLSQDEQAALLAACHHCSWPKTYLLVLLALTTGGRRGELLRLTWSDIDFVRREAKLATTKNGKPRTLPLTKRVIQELMRFRESGGLVFPSTVSRTQPFEPRQNWYTAVARAGIGHLRFHDLRHTAASNLAHAGRNLFEIGDLLGHSSTQMTQRYSHLTTDHKRNMVDQVMGGLG